jgi:hypothetical protein
VRTAEPPIGSFGRTDVDELAAAWEVLDVSGCRRKKAEEDVDEGDRGMYGCSRGIRRPVIGVVEDGECGKTENRKLRMRTMGM